jgi:hypothetical protein
MDPELGLRNGPDAPLPLILGMKLQLPPTMTLFTSLFPHTRHHQHRCIVPSSYRGRDRALLWPIQDTLPQARHWGPAERISLAFPRVVPFRALARTQAQLPGWLVQEEEAR